MESVLRYLIGYFPDLLEVNLTASIVILFVICARLFLRRAPKIFSYVLWAIVLLRLLVPISIESSVSVVPERTAFVSMVELNEAMPRIEFESSGDRANNQWIRENTPPGESFAQTSRSLDAQTYLTFSWLAGMAFMLLHSVVSYWKLRKRVRVTIPLHKGIYIADDIDTPFVMGIFRPVIYLPGTLDKAEREYIIAHERHHIRRGDHVFKALGFLALMIHWFNPLVWVAFVLASRDMEMSCDEAVIHKFSEDVRADYSASLLNLATGHRLFAGTPLAFGEGNPTGRVRNLANWKKPKRWIILICVLLCVVLAVCLLTDQKDGFDWSSTWMEGPTTCTLGDLNYTAPEGLAVQGMDVEHNGNAWDVGNAFYVGDTFVGGVALRYQNSADGLDLFTPEWAAAIGVPEALDTSMGHIGRSSAYADYEITYFPDIPVNYDDNFEIILDENGKFMIENEVTHYFFINGTDVYDIWFYNNRLPDTMRESMLKTCFVEGISDIAVIETRFGEEKKALEQCRNVLALIQNNGSSKIETKQENGSFALNDKTLCTDWIYEDRRLHICVIPESGGSSMFGGLRVDGISYECDSRQQWNETARWDWPDPWLTSFQWDDSIVSYMDTLSDESGTTVMLRIDQPFAEGDNQQPHYFVNFNFDADGIFRNVYVQTNLFTNNAISKTESVVSLDSELIESEILEEYQRAIQ